MNGEHIHSNLSIMTAVTSIDLQNLEARFSTTVTNMAAEKRGAHEHIMNEYRTGHNEQQVAIDNLSAEFTKGGRLEILEKKWAEAHAEFEEKMKTYSKSVDDRIAKLDAQFVKGGKLNELETAWTKTHEDMKKDMQTFKDRMDEAINHQGRQSSIHSEAIDKYQKQLSVHEQVFVNLKYELDVKTAKLDGAVASAMGSLTAQTHSTEGHERRSTRTLDSEKKFEATELISGSETISAIKEWKRKFTILLDSTVGGALEALEWAEAQVEDIDLALIETEPAMKTVLLRLNKELYALLMIKCSGTSATSLRSVNFRKGLEAWRRLWTELGRRDNESLREEYRLLTNPSKSIPKASNIAEFLDAWETAVSELENINRQEYRVTDQHKYDIILDILPNDIKNLVMADRGYGKSTDWNSLNTFIRNQSRMARNREQVAGSPMPGVMAVEKNETEPEPQHSQDDWFNFLSTDDGIQHIADNPHDLEAQSMLASLVIKGKGKGRDKGGGKAGGKAKGKGAQWGKGFQGNCHGCGVWGHTKNSPQCSLNKAKGKSSGSVGEVAGQAPASAGAPINQRGTQQRNCWMLEEIPAGFRACMPSQEELQGFDACMPCNVNSVSTSDPIDDDKKAALAWMEVNKVREERSTVGGPQYFQSDDQSAFDHEIEEYPSIDEIFHIVSRKKQKLPSKPMKPQWSPEIEALAAAIESKGNMKVKIGKMIPKEVEKARDDVVKAQPPQMPMEPVMEPTTKVAFGIDSKQGIGFGINLIEDMEVQKDVNAVASKRVKVLIPVAVDSGSVANVAPGEVFTKAAQSLGPAVAKFFAANKQPILSKGILSILGMTDQNNPAQIEMDFDICNVSRPLMSASKVTKKQNRVVLDDEPGCSYIEHKPTGEKIPLRNEGSLWFLDIWVEMDEKDVPAQHFTRQVKS